MCDSRTTAGRRLRRDCVSVFNTPLNLANICRSLGAADADRLRRQSLGAQGHLSFGGSRPTHESERRFGRPLFASGGCATQIAIPQREVRETSQFVPHVVRPPRLSSSRVSEQVSRGVPPRDSVIVALLETGVEKSERRARVRVPPCEVSTPRRVSRVRAGHSLGPVRRAVRA